MTFEKFTEIVMNNPDYTEKEGRVPTLKQLKRSGAKVGFKFKSRDCKIWVFRNGYILGKRLKKDGTKDRHTVYHLSSIINDMKYDNYHTLIKKEEYDEIDAKKVLLLFIDMRIDNNIAICEKNEAPCYIDNNDMFYYNIIDEHYFEWTISAEDSYLLRLEKENRNKIISILKGYAQDADFLTDTQKERYKMYFFENKSQEKIAEILGVSRASVQDSINQIIKKIKKQFEKEGLYIK